MTSHDSHLGLHCLSMLLVNIIYKFPVQKGPLQLRLVIIIYKVMKYIKILIIYNAYFKKAVFHSRENIKSCIFTAVKI